MPQRTSPSTIRTTTCNLPTPAWTREFELIHLLMEERKRERERERGREREREARRRRGSASARIILRGPTSTNSHTHSSSLSHTHSLTHSLTYFTHSLTAGLGVTLSTSSRSRPSSLLSLTPTRYRTSRVLYSSISFRCYAFVPLLLSDSGAGSCCTSAKALQCHS